LNFKVSDLYKYDKNIPPETYVPAAHRQVHCDVCDKVVISFPPYITGTCDVTDGWWRHHKWRHLCRHHDSKDAVSATYHHHHLREID